MGGEGRQVAPTPLARTSPGSGADHLDRSPPERIALEVTPTGWAVFYDQEAEAEALAEELGTVVKHAGLLGNPFFKRFSVVKVREPDSAFQSQKRVVRGK